MILRVIYKDNIKMYEFPHTKKVFNFGKNHEFLYYEQYFHEQNKGVTIPMAKIKVWDVIE